MAASSCNLMMAASLSRGRRIGGCAPTGGGGDGGWPHWRHRLFCGDGGRCRWWCSGARKAARRGTTSGTDSRHPECTKIPKQQIVCTQTKLYRLIYNKDVVLKTACRRAGDGQYGQHRVRKAR